MMNYVALYGFLRAISLLATIFFWVIIYCLLFKNITIADAPEVNKISIILLILLLLMPYTFYMAFVKFYRRFSLEVIMAMVVTYDIDHEKTKPRNITMQ